jgi:hypothetical protein
MAKSEEDESAEATGNTRAKDLGGKARKSSKGKAKVVVVPEAAEDALAKPSEGEVVEVREERWTFSRYNPSHRRRSERLFETISGAWVLFRRKTVRRNNFRERPSDPIGICESLLCGAPCHRVMLKCAI